MMDEEKIKEYEKTIGIYLNCKTRIGDSKGLFDYDSNEVNSINFFLKRKHILENQNIKI